MKLAEALSRRSALMEKSQQLRSRLKDCIRVQEGDEPTEDADQVIQELDQTLGELRNLIYRINLTNTNAVVDGRNLTSLLAERDTLSMRTKTLYEGLKHLTEREERYGRMEIKYVRMVDAKEFRKRHDQSAVRLRELDLKIQALGWSTDLIED